MNPPLFELGTQALDTLMRCTIVPRDGGKRTDVLSAFDVLAYLVRGYEQPRGEGDETNSV